MSPLLTLAWLLLQGGTALAAEPASLTAALEDARTNPEKPFELRVDCTDQDGRRSLQVIQGTVAVWGNERQLLLTDDDRGKLLDTLIDAGFAGFEARYGETRKAEKQEAPLRVSCRVRVVLDGLEKSSVQVMDGEQSDELLGLARDLLDLVEPLADAGVTADSIEDGLGKLAAGALAPEVLELRMVRLPDAGTDPGGWILRIAGGQVSHQPYTPGSVVGYTETRDLSAEEVRGIVAALRESEFSTLPINVRATGLIEIELGVLGRRKTVAGRPTFRAASTEAEARFKRLVEILAEVPAHP